MTLPGQNVSVWKRQFSERSIQYEEYGEDAQKQSLPVFSGGGEREVGGGVVLIQSYKEPLEAGVDGHWRHTDGKAFGS